MCQEKEAFGGPVEVPRTSRHAFRSWARKSNEQGLAGFGAAREQTTAAITQTRGTRLEPQDENCLCLGLRLPATGSASASAFALLLDGMDGHDRAEKKQSGLVRTLGLMLNPQLSRM